MPEPEGRDGELDRHRGDVGRVGVQRERLAPVREHVVDDGRLADPRQEVVAQHPLVVLDDALARPREALRGGRAGRQRVDHAVVEADDGEVRLRHRQVLVVALVGDDRLALLRGRRAGAAREVVPVHRRVGVDRHRPAHLQVAVVLVERGAGRVRRSRAVERVEVQARRAALQQLRGRHVLAQHHRRLVERQVVVDELAEVGVAGRDRARAAAARASWPSRASCGSPRPARCRAGPAGRSGTAAPPAPRPPP